MHSQSVQSPPPLETFYHPGLNSVPVKVKVTQLCLTLRPQGLYSPWNSPGQNTRVGNRSLLQGIFTTQGSDWGLLHCRWILYQLSHQGSLRILELVSYPFSNGSSWPRNQPGSPALQVDSLPAEVSEKPRQRYNQLQSESHSVLSDSLRPHRLYSPWNSPDQNTEVGQFSSVQSHSYV